MSITVTYSIAEIFLGIFVRRSRSMLRIRSGFIRWICIPVYHIRVCARKGRGGADDEALLWGWQRWHSSSAHHHRRTLRSTLRPTALMHHNAWNWKNQINHPRQTKITSPNYFFRILLISFVFNLQLIIISAII